MDKSMRDKIIKCFDMVLAERDEEENDVEMDDETREIMLKSVKKLIGGRDINQTKISDLSVSEFVDLVYAVSKKISDQAFCDMNFARACEEYGGGMGGI